MSLSISKELAQAIADYLQQRPYREVAGLLAEMANMKFLDKDIKEQPVSRETPSVVPIKHEE